MDTSGVRNLFDRVLDTPAPPMTTSDAVLNRAKRVRRRRHTLLAGVGSTLGIAVLTAAVTVGPGPLGGLGLPSGGHRPGHSTETPEQVARRLTEVLRGALASTLPGATFTRVEVPGAEEPPGDALQFTYRNEMYSAEADVQDPAGTGHVGVYLRREKLPGGRPDVCATAVGACQPEHGEHGETIGVHGDGRPGLSGFNLIAYFPDDVQVHISASNAGASNPSKADEPIAQRPSAPLTEADGRRLAPVLWLAFHNRPIPTPRLSTPPPTSPPPTTPRSGGPG